MLCSLVATLAITTAVHAESVENVRKQLSDLKVAIASQVNLKATYDDACYDKPAKDPTPFHDGGEGYQELIAAGKEAMLLMGVAYNLEYEGYDKLWTDPTVKDGIDGMHARLQNIVKSRPTQPENGWKGGTFGMAATLDGMLVVSIAGTNDFSDAFADAKLATSERVWLPGPEPGQDGSEYGSHTFYDAGVGAVEYWKKIRDALQDRIEEHFGGVTGKPVLVVGHSLGGAIANLAAVELANKYGARVRLVTAGAPRVWDRAASFHANYDHPVSSARVVQEKLIVGGVGNRDAGGCAQPPSESGKICTQRFVNYGDLVSKVPFCGGDGFSHVGNGGFYINEFADKNEDALVVAPQSRDFTPYGDNLKFHSLQVYYQRLNYASKFRRTDGSATSKTPS